MLPSYPVPVPVNEPIKSYAPGTPERASLKAKLAELRSGHAEIPLFINGEECAGASSRKAVMPHNHAHVLGECQLAGPDEGQRAIDGAMQALPEWSSMPFEDRAAIFLKAADLLSGPFRDEINAATMLAQSKTAFQAEIDAACELADFLRFNVYYARRIYDEQPISSEGMWNRLEYRGLEGFTFAVSPFNFTSIGGNLPTSPILMGGVSIWKPATTAIYSNWVFMKILREAGLPAGVLQFLPFPGGSLSDLLMKHPSMAGIHFTGSTEVFEGFWKTVGENIRGYRNYPRIVGETGGKDFVFAHSSSDTTALATALVRGAFEYQGQKCSAASRAYIPESLWPAVRQEMESQLAEIRMGDPEDFGNFLNAVIDARAFASIRGYIEQAKDSADAEILFGGGCDDTTGYFIEPTVIQAKKPDFLTMREEIFGPVLTVFVYKDKDFEETLKIADSTSEYALTGAVFGRDRAAVRQASLALKNAAGNFYVNDKPTGAVVGQQPFGGGRKSGTNDKAGSMYNLLRWCNIRTVKETAVPARHFAYPFLSSED